MGTQYSEEELALLKKRLVESKAATLPFGQRLDAATIVDVDVTDTLAGKSLVTLTQSVNGVTHKGFPYTVQRENLGDVINSLDLHSVLAGLDFPNQTAETLATTLTESGLTIDAASIEVTDAIEELLVLTCTNKSIRFKGTVRIRKLDGEVPTIETLESQSGDTIVDQSGNPIEINP